METVSTFRRVRASVLTMQEGWRRSGTYVTARMRRPGGASSCLAVLSAIVLAAGCSSGSTPSASSGSPGSTVVTAVATINAWGSILAQLGGMHVHETSIITNPDTDPHAYEPTPADGRTIATAQLFVENGIGYDVWAAKALAANPDSNRTVINV